VMSALVAAVSLGGLVAVIVTGLEQRRRELAVLRSIGAGPGPVFALLIIEGTLVTGLGAVLGALACSAATIGLGPLVQARFGVGLGLGGPTAAQWGLLAAVQLAGMLASLAPGWRAYRLSLSDGLAPKGS
jgi:putative ABC transport system permease protein